MQQLSGIDSYFLNSERGNIRNHVAGLAIYDPSTAPDGMVRFKDILAHFSRRLDRHELFRRRLVTVPYGVDRPYWIEDPDVDLEFHIRHIALPEPGDWRQLMIQAARLHSHPLDRSRPLWEVYVIEGLDRIPGLPKGSFALLTKLHHASVDGVAASRVLGALHCTSPEPDPPLSGVETLYGERDPLALELYSRAVASGVSHATGIASFSMKTLRSIAGLAGSQVAAGLETGGDHRPTAMPKIHRAPKTRFNGKVSANRVVEGLAFPLDQIQKARARLPGTTINDIFLGVCGGALRRYLLDKGELPRKSLIALMPMDMRSEGQEAAPGNQVGGVPTPIRTDLKDPIERLQACRLESRAAIESVRALGSSLIGDVLNELPSALAQAFMRYAVFPQINMTASNVRGPNASLYLAGARLVSLYPLNVATDYLGLNVTAFTYDGTMWISVVSCRNMLPDPAFFAQCLQESYDELIAALEALPAVPESGKPARKPPNKIGEKMAKKGASGKRGVKGRRKAPYASRRTAKPA